MASVEGQENRVQRGEAVLPSADITGDTSADQGQERGERSREHAELDSALAVPQDCYFFVYSSLMLGKIPNSEELRQDFLEYLKATQEEIASRPGLPLEQVRAAVALEREKMLAPRSNEELKEYIKPYKNIRAEEAEKDEILLSSLLKEADQERERKQELVKAFEKFRRTYGTKALVRFKHAAQAQGFSGGDAVEMLYRYYGRDIAEAEERAGYVSQVNGVNERLLFILAQELDSEQPTAKTRKVINTSELPKDKRILKEAEKVISQLEELKDQWKKLTEEKDNTDSYQEEFLAKLQDIIQEVQNSGHFGRDIHIPENPEGEKLRRAIYNAEAFIRGEHTIEDVERMEAIESHLREYEDELQELVQLLLEQHLPLGEFQAALLTALRDSGNSELVGLGEYIKKADSRLLKIVAQNMFGPHNPDLEDPEVPTPPEVVKHNAEIEPEVIVKDSLEFEGGENTEKGEGREAIESTEGTEETAPVQSNEASIIAQPEVKEMQLTKEAVEILDSHGHEDVLADKEEVYISWKQRVPENPYKQHTEQELRRAFQAYWDLIKYNEIQDLIEAGLVDDWQGFVKKHQ